MSLGFDALAAQALAELPALAFTGVTGTASITESADTLSATGSLTVSGTNAQTEGADTVSGTGNVPVSATYSATEGADTLSASGTAGVASADGTFSATEGADTLSASGNVVVSSSYTVTEGADTVAGSGNIPVSGTNAQTEGADTVSAAGNVPVTSSFAATESADTLAATGSVPTAAVDGTASLTEGTDTLDASGGPQSSAGGDYDDKPKKRKFIVRKGNSLLVFNSEAEAANVIAAEAQDALPVEVKAKAKTARKKAAKDVSVDPVATYDVNAMLAALQARADAEHMLNQQRYEAFIAAYEQFIDDEEVELLLLAM